MTNSPLKDARLKPITVKVFFPADMGVGEDRARWYIEGAIRGWWQQFATERDQIRKMRDAVVAFQAALPQESVAAAPAGVVGAVYQASGYPPHTREELDGMLDSLRRENGHHFADGRWNINTMRRLIGLARAALSAPAPSPGGLGRDFGEIAFAAFAKVCHGSTLDEADASLQQHYINFAVEVASALSPPSPSGEVVKAMWEKLEYGCVWLRDEQGRRDGIDEQATDTVMAEAAAMLSAQADTIRRLQAYAELSGGEGSSGANRAGEGPDGPFASDSSRQSEGGV